MEPLFYGSSDASRAARWKPARDPEMNSPFHYSVAQSFTRFPGGRRRQHGPHSGEEFRENIALPLLDKYDRIVFDLTGSAGYSSGFLDEAFGELGAILGLAEVTRRIVITAE